MTPSPFTLSPSHSHIPQSNLGPYRIQNVIRTGQGLIDKKQCQGAEEVVSQRLTTIGDQWEYLVQKSTEKSMKLKEASKQQVRCSCRAGVDGKVLAIIELP